MAFYKTCVKFFIRPDGAYPYTMKKPIALLAAFALFAVAMPMAAAQADEYTQERTVEGGDFATHHEATSYTAGYTVSYQSNYLVVYEHGDSWSVAHNVSASAGAPVGITDEGEVAYVDDSDDIIVADATSSSFSTVETINGAYEGVTYSDDDSTLYAHNGSSGELHAFDTSDYTKSDTYTLSQFTSGITHTLDVSEEHDTAVVSAGDADFEVVNLADGTTAYEDLSSYWQSQPEVYVDSDGRIWTSGNSAPNATVWTYSFDGSTLTQEHKEVVDGSGDLHHTFSIAPDGSRAFVASINGDNVVYDTSNLTASYEQITLLSDAGSYYTSSDWFVTDGSANLHWGQDDTSGNAGAITVYTTDYTADSGVPDVDNAALLELLIGAAVIATLVGLLN